MIEQRKTLMQSLKPSIKSSSTSLDRTGDPSPPARCEQLHAIAYDSIAISPLMVSTLRSLHEQSIEANRQHSVTGVLLYNAGRFMQYIEGPRVEVLRLFERIKGDTRHRKVTELMSEPIAQRAFAQWHMGLAQATASDILAISTANWQRVSGEMQRAVTEHSPGMALLLEFWQPLEADTALHRAHPRAG